MDLSKYKLLIVRLLTGIQGKADAQAASYKAQIEEISAECATLRELTEDQSEALSAAGEKIAQISADAAQLSAKVMELTAALATAEKSTQDALVAQAGAAAAALDALTSELEKEYAPIEVKAEEMLETAENVNEKSTTLEDNYNVSPAADAIAQAVADEPLIETPAVVAETVIEVAVETPAEVVSAAIEAIEAA